MAARFQAIRLRKEREQAELNAVTDAMRQAEQSKLVMARTFHERKAHDLLSQAESRMEGTMISPKDKATALERVRGVGEFGLVRQFPSPSTEIPVGGGFRLGGGGVRYVDSAEPKFAVERPGKRMFLKPGPSPGAKYPAVMGYK